MKKSSLIGHTAEIYGELLTGTRPADSFIDTFFRSHKYLGSHDRRFIADTVYGMLRNRRRIEWLLDKAGSGSVRISEKRKSLLAVLVYLAVIAGLSEEELAIRTLADADDAVVLVGLLRTARELNREIRDDSAASSADAAKLSIQFSFPELVTEQWLERYGESETIELCSALNQPAPLTLRVNTLKATINECRNALVKEGIQTEPTKYSPFGLHVGKRTNIFQLEVFKQGFFEVQDEGSQLLTLLVDPKPTSKVIDACAGGGGKALALAALMKNRGVIYALDTNAYRLEALRKRIRRSGVDTIRVRLVKESERSPDLIGLGDNVLVDAPCSGLGTVRRNPGLKWSVTPESIGELSAKQSAVLRSAAFYVKPNGRLVYATCTLTKSENEEVVERFLVEHPEFELMHPSMIFARHHLESLAKEKYFQLLPHRHGTDGFFAAVMKKVE